MKVWRGLSFSFWFSLHRFCGFFWVITWI